MSKNPKMLLLRVWHYKRGVTWGRATRTGEISAVYAQNKPGHIIITAPRRARSRWQSILERRYYLNHFSKYDDRPMLRAHGRLPTGGKSTAESFAVVYINKEGETLIRNFYGRICLMNESDWLAYRDWKDDRPWWGDKHDSVEGEKDPAPPPPPAAEEPAAEEPEPEPAPAPVPVKPVSVKELGEQIQTLKVMHDAGVPITEEDAAVKDALVALPVDINPAPERFCVCPNERRYNAARARLESGGCPKHGYFHFEHQPNTELWVAYETKDDNGNTVIEGGRTECVSYDDVKWPMAAGKRDKNPPRESE